MVISVEFRKLDPGPEVFCKDLFPGQVSMELGSVNSDPTRRQSLKDNACMYICSMDPGKKDPSDAFNLLTFVLIV